MYPTTRRQTNLTGRFFAAMIMAHTGSDKDEITATFFPEIIDPAEVAARKMVKDCAERRAEWLRVYGREMPATCWTAMVERAAKRRLAREL